MFGLPVGCWICRPNPQTGSRTPGTSPWQVTSHQNLTDPARKRCLAKAQGRSPIAPKFVPCACLGLDRWQRAWLATPLLLCSCDSLSTDGSRTFGYSGGYFVNRIKVILAAAVALL